jgi:rRNA pseudouridine-1189 N-methylase Emg1 (Nep1/Mra1 family)
MHTINMMLGICLLYLMEHLFKKVRINTKADKMVLEIEDKWVILDLEELHQYIKKNKLKKVYVNDLLSKLEWTIFLAKL